MAQSAASSRALVEQLALLTASFSRLSSAVVARQTTAAAALPMPIAQLANNPPQSPTIASVIAMETHAQPTSPSSTGDEPYWRPSTPVAADCVTAQDGHSTDEADSEQAESAPASPAFQLSTQQPASGSTTGHSAAPLPLAKELDAGSINNTAYFHSEDESTPVAAQLAEQPESDVALWPFVESPPCMICHADVGCLATAQRWPVSTDHTDAEDVAAASEVAILKHEQDAMLQVRHTVLRPPLYPTRCRELLFAGAACSATARVSSPSDQQILKHSHSHRRWKTSI